MMINTRKENQKAINLLLIKEFILFLFVKEGLIGGLLMRQALCKC